MRQKINYWLEWSLESKVGIPAINVTSFDTMLGVSFAANHHNLPVIVQVSSKNVITKGAAYWKEIFDSVQKITNADCYLHLDHCNDLSVLNACINNGWDMVMFDGSQFPGEENCLISSQVVKMAHQNSVAVEVEMGSIGGEEDGFNSKPAYAELDWIIKLVKCAKPDCIAVGFGNVHGEYVAKENLRWDILEDSYRVTKIPQVLHGGSGLTDSEITKAINCGVVKINISTDLKKAIRTAIDNCGRSAKSLNSPIIYSDAMTHAAFELTEKCFKRFRVEG